MKVFKRSGPRIVLIGNLIITIVLYASPAVSQQAEKEQLPEKETTYDDSPIGFGPGPLWFDHAREGELTVDKVRADLERWLAQIGNPRLKIGNVTEKDTRTITAEIVTVDNSLVETFDIDRRTGNVWQFQYPGYWMPHHGGPYWGMGYGRHFGMPFPFLGMFFFFVMLIIVAALISLLFRSRFNYRKDMGRTDSSPLDLLNRRYASGTIGREEYLQKKQEILKGQ